MGAASWNGRERVVSATEGQQLVVAALAAARPDEAVGQDAAFEEGVGTCQVTCAAVAAALGYEAVTACSLL